MRAFALSGLVTAVFFQASQFTIPAGKQLPFAAIARQIDPMAVCDAEGRTGITTASAESSSTPGDRGSRQPPRSAGALDNSMDWIKIGLGGRSSLCC